MAQDRRNPAFPRMISKFCRQRGALVLPPRDVELLCGYLVDLFRRGVTPPARGRGLDWTEIADACGIDRETLLDATETIRPGFEALRRELLKPAGRGRRPARGRPAKVRSASSKAVEAPRQKKPGRPFTSVEAVPQARFDEWVDPAAFHAAFDLHLRRFGETVAGLSRALASLGHPIEYSTLRMWRLGKKAPLWHESLAVLELLERRWGLAPGYFKSRLPRPSAATYGHRPASIEPSERRRIAWHLPDDFDRRPAAEQEEILDWVRRVVVAGATDYRRYQSAAMKHRFALRFPGLQPVRSNARTETNLDDLSSGTVRAPEALTAEMRELVAFKSATLSPLGYQRRGIWGPETVGQKLEHLGLMLGALVAAPRGAVRGAGAPLSSLTLALLVMPQVWDWYVRWREERRGFFTAWEVDMLAIGAALTAPDVGWLTQSPHLAARLQAIPGLVTADQVAEVQADWPAACARLHAFAKARGKEIQRVAKVHHDPFEPILVILEADSPVGEYRKIAEEILRLAPRNERYPKAAAEAARAFLMIRFGLHLGFRQRNLRELLLCPRERAPTPERQLADLRRGELRWSERDGGWEVFVPSVAFKNADSSFFGGRPFRLVLPDISDLYAHIDAYVARHRKVLLGRAADPGTFFVKTVKVSSRSAAYDQTTFYEAWRWIIQRYGIFNPYTGRGAIPGLLPHGPHNVRDVLATHILKQTGSYEQASYAIQDTPDMVAQHYGRFLPQDKAALAAQVLNRAWA